MKLAPMPCCYVSLSGLADAAYGLQSGQEADKMTTAGRKHVFDLRFQPNHYFLIYAETGSAGASPGALPV
jgi:hypothetical protein